MDSASSTRHTYRKRIARILRRAESAPDRAALLLRSDLQDLLGEFKRLARTEPAVVLDLLLVLHERLAAAVSKLDDDSGFLSDVVVDAGEQARHILVRDAERDEQRVDRRQAFERLFSLWSTDEEGLFADLGDLLIASAVTPADEVVIRNLLAEQIDALPLVFPPARGAAGDLERTVLIADRHRLERLMGVLLSRHGRHEYAVLVARDHARRTGDALDLVEALSEAGQTAEAVRVARRALASPRSFQRERLQALLDDLLATSTKGGGEGPASSRRELEARFLAEPTRKTYDALERVVPDDQWPRVRRRVLEHLHKHQKAPTLLFTLYLEAGDVVEADGLVVTQPVEADELEKGAERIMGEHGDKAAGWLLIAAHRRLQSRRASAYPQVLKCLERMRELAEASDQVAAFERAMQRFRSRYSRRTRLMQMLAEAGLAK